MTPANEKRALQLVMLAACIVPLTAGPMGIWRGAAWMAHGAEVSADLDSHFRYMSGIFTGVGLAFLSCIRTIETKSVRLRLLGACVVIGGLARALSWAQLGPPDLGNRFGLVMELVVVPLILLWQWRLARRWATTPYRG